MRLAEFNRCLPSDAADILFDICHSRRWVEKMVENRPYVDLGELLAAADSSWADMAEQDILRASQGHAKIGDLSALRDSYSAASAEQGQIKEADELVLLDLINMNQDYEQRNGFIFIVCATGKSAIEMRDILAARLNNTRAQELVTAALEQGKITRLRLKKQFKTEDA